MTLINIQAVVATNYIYDMWLYKYWIRASEQDIKETKVHNLICLLTMTTVIQSL